MNVTNTIKGVVNATKYTVTAPIIKEDYGLYLKIEGLDLPAVYEVDFSNSENSGSSVTMVGNADGVLIPRQFIKSGQDVFAFLYWNGEDFGRTVYKFRIPNKLRPDRTDIDPDPEEQSLIDQAIAALNNAVEQTAADVETTTAKASEATAAAETATQKASEAAASATAAGTYATRAEAAQRAAETARDTATAKASAAATSADNASLSAVNALDSASDAAISAGQASASAIAAGQSALDAKTYRDSAGLSAENAAMYAEAASGSAVSASASATTATNKASEAAQSATDASTAKNDAVTAKTAAEAAQTAAETAQGLAEDAQTGAETAQAAAEAAIYTKAPIIEDTATGAVASFPDGADDVPMRSLKVGIDPVQDLHGQENPWPAGGGKNQSMPIGSTTFAGITTATNADGITTVSGTATGNGGRKNLCSESFTLKAGTYVLSHNGTGAWGTSLNISEPDSSGAAIVSLQSTNASIAFTLEQDTSVVVGINVLSGNTYSGTVKPQIESGSTATAWVPYSNICPITGWTGVNVANLGDDTNLQYFNGLLDGTYGFVDLGTLTWELKDGVSSTQYFLSSAVGDAKAPVNNTTVANVLSTKYMPNEAYLIYAGNDGIALDTVKKVRVHDASYSTAADFKTAMSGAYLIYELATPTNPSTTPTQFNDLLSAFDLAGYVLPISWETESGTVYGGSLDVVNGVLTVDMASVDLGTLNWSYITTSDRNYFRVAPSGLKFNTPNIICSKYPYEGTKYDSQMASANDKALYLGTNSSFAQIKDSSYTDAATFKTAMRGVQLVYELATPIVYHLTPQEVRTLLGQNNVWADTGNSTVEYYADTKRYIDKRIAEIVN